MLIGIGGANVGVYAEREHAFALARAAEAAGVESLWTREHVVVPTSYESTYPYAANGRMSDGTPIAIADPLLWCATTSAVTERIQFGTGVLILPLHNPVMLAKRVATVDRLSGGRIKVGVGVGWLKEEFDAVGASWPHRGKRIDEYIGVMRLLWMEDEASFAGNFVQIDRVQCDPKPLQQPAPPIIVGGHTEAAAKRAGRLGDGFYPYAPIEQIKQLVDLARGSAVEAGRDPDRLEVTVSAGPAPDLDTVKRYEALGVHRLVVQIPTRDPDEIDSSMTDLHDRLLSRLDNL